jgi:outer membrane receptor protein involved in Fe transport
MPLGSQTELQASGLAFIDRRERGVDFTGNRTDGADAALRLVGQGDWQWSALGYGQWRELRSSFASVSDGRGIATRVSLQDSVPSNAFGGNFEIRPPLGKWLELRLGGDFRRAEGESRELFSYVAGEPTRRRRAGGESLTAGLFGEITADLGKLILSGGGRLDRWRINDGELVEWVIVTGAPLRNDQYPGRSGWRPTARAGAVLDVVKGLKFRSAAYLGWRLPTLNELFRPFRAGQDATAANADLEPERLAGGEIGATFARKELTLSVTAFTNRLSDAIANVTLGEGPGTFPGVGFVPSGGTYRQRQNLDSVSVHGIEASAQLKHGPFTGSLGMSLTDAKIHAGGPAVELDGLRPAQTPRLAATAGLSWENRGRALSLVLRHVGNQFEDDLNSERLPPATTIDAFAAWPVGSGVQLVGRGENLLDKTVVAGIGSDGAVERATPRTFWIGLRVSR